MNRIEMFLELKKDPSKTFTDGVCNYFVNCHGEACFIKIDDKSFNGTKKVNCLDFRDNSDYKEVKKPFKDRIKKCDIYYFFDTLLDVSGVKFSNDWEDREMIKIKNFFETREECEEVVRKIKEMLKVLK